MWQTLQWSSFGYMSDTEEMLNNFASTARREFWTNKGNVWIRGTQTRDMLRQFIITHKTSTDELRKVQMLVCLDKSGNSDPPLVITTTPLYLKKVTVA
jgi:hypothetical protein